MLREHEGKRIRLLGGRILGQLFDFQLIVR